MPKPLVALLTAVIAALALPAAAPASYTFGSRMRNDPTDGSCNGVTAPCTYVSFIHPSDPNGDPNSSGAPADGVITKFRIRAFGAGASVTFRLADITQSADKSSATANPAGTGPTVNIKGVPDTNNNAVIEEFPARLPVKKGNHLAIDTSSANAIYNSSGSKFSYVFAPPLVEGQGQRASSDSASELLVAATVEPDADKDGFGDETQDMCPSDPRQQGACDTTGPIFNHFGLTKFAFTSKTTVVVRLGEAGKVTFTFRKRKRIHRHLRYVGILGSFSRTFTAPGLKRIVFTGRVNGRRLAVGYYQLVATSQDALGNKKVAVRGFRVLPLPRRRR